MKLTLQELLEANTKVAKDMLMMGSGKGQLRPMFIIQHGGGELMSIVTMWSNDEEKDQMVRAIQLKMKELNADAYVHISEAWMAHVDMKAQPELINVAPSKRNDRYEVLIIAANDHLESKVAIEEILRDDKGKITGTRKIDIPGGVFEGRMMGLLK
jgi:cellobiose-specific phosphotransferase system component IIA